MVLLASTLLGCVVAYYYYAIRETPGIREPFDTNLFLNNHADRVALSGMPYKEALELFVPREPGLLGELITATEKGWPESDPKIKQWVENNSSALQEIHKIIKKHPKDVAFPVKSIYDDIFDTRVFQFVDLLTLKASKALYDGDSESAWIHLHASLLLCVNYGLQGRVEYNGAGERSLKTVVDSISDWAAHKNTSTELLRNSLPTIEGEFERIPPLSETVKYEYLYITSALKRKSSVALFKNMRSPPEDVFEKLSNAGRDASWTISEPERSIKLARIVVANWLSQCDNPSQLQNIDYEYGAYKTPRGPDSNMMRVGIESSLIGPYLQMTGAGLEWLKRDRDFNRVRLTTTIAICVYARAHGRYPENLQALDEQGFSSRDLLDPYGKPGDLLRYQIRNGQAIVWSVGPNLIDDGGKTLSGYRQGDLVFSLPHLNKK